MSTRPLERTAVRGGRRPSLHVLAAVRTRVELVQFVRERDAVIFIFAYPMVMMVIFGSVFGSQDVGPGTSFAEYFLPGIAATGIMLTSFQSLAITIAMERDDGTLKRLRGTPLPPVAYVLGKVGLVLATTVVQLALLLAIAVVAYDVELPDGAGWATFGWVAVLSVTAGTVLGVAASGLPRSGRSASAVISPIVIVLQFFSGVFFVYSDLPSWMRAVAEVFPLKWMAQGMRSVFLPPEMEALEVGASWQHGPTAAVLLAWTALGLVVAVRTFRWTRRDAG